MIDQAGDDTAGLVVSRANDASGVAARQLAAIEHGLEHCARFRRQAVEADLFFRPKQDAHAQRQAS